MTIFREFLFQYFYVSGSLLVYVYICESQQARGVAKECPSFPPSFFPSFIHSTYHTSGVKSCRCGDFFSTRLKPSKSAMTRSNRTTPQLSNSQFAVHFTTTFSIVINKKRSSWAGFYVHSEQNQNRKKFHTKH